ncbi:hypothetical protein E2553_22050 [Paraburkholderia dipogonis]|uniref:Uncharacterized protein n=1 Tax=Paraburkholderia dipogonis TaxID=1211383 RepID=A0A4Y8MQ32_9BURK|nr:hypothetical protein [Paraburkholderia dipogonis]TFE39524.1 hypothetical protein E2553_22050 [Paraburkholderia dipogonis]
MIELPTRRRGSGVSFMMDHTASGALTVALDPECRQTTWRRAQLDEFFAWITNGANYATPLLYDNSAWALTFISPSPRCMRKTLSANSAILTEILAATVN